MTESHPIHSIQSPAVHENSNPIDKRPDHPFDTVLGESMEASKRLDGLHENAEAITTEFALESASFLWAAKTHLVEKAETLLNDLSNYQERLANPAYSLEDMMPLVLDLERKHKKLALDLDSFEWDDKLKSILEQVVKVSSVEVMRFNCGEYVNP